MNVGDLILPVHWFLLLVCLGLGGAALYFVLADAWADYVAPLLQRMESVDGMVSSTPQRGTE